MTRRPAADETIILGERSGAAGRSERFFVPDLALYLHESVMVLKRWGRKTRLLKRQRLCATGGNTHAYFFTRYGAMRCIAHFRAFQGGEILAGRDYHHNQTRIWDYARRYQERYRSERRCR